MCVSLCGRVKQRKEDRRKRRRHTTRKEKHTHPSAMLLPPPPAPSALRVPGEPEDPLAAVDEAERALAESVRR